MSSSTVNWGILGAGAIARAFANGVKQSKHAKLVAIGSRTQSKADAFAKEFAIPTAHGSYEALLADPNVQAVYIATPHPQHAPWAIAAAKAGKHLIVEKPLAPNYGQAMAIVEAAEVHHVFLMEAFMYRCHPQTAKVVQLIREGAIGKVSVIQATFSFQSGFNPDSRLWSNESAGGGILDVGCYPVSYARLIAGAATGKDFADPIHVSGAGKLHPQTKVDEYALATLKFPGDIVANLATGVGLNQENVVRIFGTEGSITLSNPWVANREGNAPSKFTLNKKGKAEEITVDSPVTSFALEIDIASQAILAGRTQAPSPAMTPADTLGNIRTLDQWRQAVGVVYEFEKPGKVPTVTGRPLARSPQATMKYGKVERLDKPVSRLVMGCDNQPNLPHAAAMFDDFFEHGGNTFDTAYIYGGGAHERQLGQWIKTRNLREQVVVIVKGAHTPHCHPFPLSQQLKESLERSEFGYADIYIMHRDNPEVPVGEFVDVLNEHVKAGRIKIFGGSNWSIQRIQEANAYAAKKGLQPFSLVSNNFSLARMVDPVWHGCISASDPQSRAWLTETQTPLFAWSSQARGFFLPGRAAPDKKEDAELVRCWYSEDNFQRLARANELAKKKNVLPINIALAYVLSQPFPTFPLIGPRYLSETRTSFPALDITLTPEELKWLNLEA
jgi:predicted dehydrogenase/aryl-alcohol dehydrogenase-like predicted oxidoreductase